MNLAVFVSGSGSNMMAIQKGIEEGKIDGQISLVISNKDKALALEKARVKGIATRVIKQKDFKDVEAHSQHLADLLGEFSIEAVLLAGYLKMIPSNITAIFENRILNIHPSLLPAFGGKGYYGRRVHEAVLKRGAKWTGVTIHMVSPEYDEGPIVLQEAVPVKPDDSVETLAKRVLEVEHKLYPRAVALLVQNKLKLKNGIVSILE